MSNKTRSFINDFRETSRRIEKLRDAFIAKGEDWYSANTTWIHVLANNSIVVNIREDSTQDLTVLYFPTRSPIPFDDFVTEVVGNGNYSNIDHLVLSKNTQGMLDLPLENYSGIVHAFIYRVEGKSVAHLTTFNVGRNCLLRDTF